LVKPVTIETGMNRTRVPSRSAPSANGSTPAVAVAISRFGRPWRSTMA
jgi:hypothetical protein